MEDIATDARIVGAAWALSHDLVAFAGAPVVAGDELLGVLTLNLKRGTLPQGDDRMLLSSFASQAAVAINNARLFAEAEARRRAAETLRDLGRALSQALDVNIVARLVADGVCTLLGGQESGLFLIEAESGDLVSLALSGDVGPAAGPSLTLPAGTGASALAIRERAPGDDDGHIGGCPHHAALRPARAHRRIAAPGRHVRAARGEGRGDRGARRGRSGWPHLRSRRDSQSRRPSRTRPHWRSTTRALYEEAHQRVRHLDSLRDVVEQILVPISLEERLTVIAGKAAELFGADRATIALRDEERDALVIRAGHGLAEGEVGRELRPDAGVLSLATATRGGALVNDYQAWPQRDPFVIQTYTERPAVAVIGYPLMIRDQIIGAISVGRHRPEQRFVRADLDRLASLAVPAALAIEHSRLYEELANRVRDLEATQAQLLQAGKLSAVGQLVSGVAHELNNPLSVILGYAQLLSARDLPPELRRPVEMMLAQGGRMAKIVQSLLLFSRQRKAERGAVDVREAIEQPLSLRATQLMLSGVRVSATYGEGVPAAEGDAHQLQQVFLNLILNAEQAILGSRVGGQRVGDAIRVTTGVRVDEGQTWVVITVADNGPGIPRDALSRIFEPFFTTKKVGEGTGLGLSVSYGIIQQHGGRLSVESRPGHTVFTIELPAATSPLPSRNAELAEVAGTGAGRGRHALVVDDEPGVLDLVAALLRQAGWEVATATGGRDALERLRGANYDLVLADMRMPDGSGEDLYRALASERGDLTERFLFMTGDTANPEAWRFIEATHASVIEKPFTAQALLSAVERVAA